MPDRGCYEDLFRFGIDGKLLMPFSDERLALARERALSLAASRTAAAGATSPGGTSPVLLAVATGLPEAEVEPPELPVRCT